MKNSVLALIALAGLLAPDRSNAQTMYIGQTFVVAASSCPAGSLPTNGQLLAISTYMDLYDVIGLSYGGDGVVSFALPDTQPIATLSPGLTVLRCIVTNGVFPQ